MWNITEAIEGRVSNRVSQTMQIGLLGAPLLIRTGAVVRLSDLNLLAIPGLAALGFNATINVLDSVEALTNAIVQRSRPHALFLLSEAPRKLEMHTEDAHTDEQYFEIDPVIAHCLLAMRQRSGEPGQLLWRMSPNSDWTAQRPDCGREVYALLTLRRAARVGLRSANLTAALLRWIAIADANPDMLIAPKDSSKNEGVAMFLSECASTQKTPAATQLRRSAAAFRSADRDRALQYLRQAVLIRMGLSAALRTALTRPESRPLTDTERRELIYLARAGANDLKVLAVHRLASDHNSDHPDVQTTLQQMLYDSSAWVRAAAKKAPK